MLMSYYTLGLSLSLVCSLVFVTRWRQQFNMYLTIANVLIPILNLSYLLLTMSKTVEGALMATKFTYLGGCYLELFIFFMVFRICKINYSKIGATLMYIFNSVLFFFVIFAEKSDLFYKSLELTSMHGITILNKEKGFVHIIFLVTVTTLMGSSILTLFYALLRKKKNISVVNALLLTSTQVVTMFCFIFSRIIPAYFNPMPLAYLYIQIIFQVVVESVSMHELGQTVFSSQAETEILGYFSTDFNYRFLNCNNLARENFDFLKDVKVDKKIKLDCPEFKIFQEMSEELAINNKIVERIIVENGKYYKITVGYLYDGRKNRGYQAVFQDDTVEQNYINLIDTYNDKLKEEVDNKTIHIQEIQNKLILGMADMVENRDTSTGGHIKRTSDVIRILMKEIIKLDPNHFTDSFYNAMVSAAPLHDLGKITVDDNILRKKGKYTKEEFDIMKTHAEKGSIIVKNLVTGVVDDEVAKIAENVAHYHHERMDGSGYPSGLKGNQIPVEARIMAIADVYDALVSKRYYKEMMEFGEAFQIIEDGMGTQFDPQFNKAFIAARSRLEAYYTEYRNSHEDEIS